LPHALGHLILGDMAVKEKPQIVAIIDDNELVRTALEGLMKSVGLPALAFAHAEEFLTSGRKHDIACLIVDIQLPGMSGLELQSLNAELYRIPTIFITAHGDENARMQAIRVGAVEFLTKPFDDEALLQSVRAALEC
jgi:FixJ family two-component response regulator